MPDFGRATRAYVSGYDRAKVQQVRLYRFERRRFIANFNGLLPLDEQIRCTTWRIDAPEIGVMSQIEISEDARESSIMFATQLGGWANIRCEITLDAGEIYTQVFRVNVREASVYFDDPAIVTGPYSLTVCREETPVTTGPSPPTLSGVMDDTGDLFALLEWTEAVAGTLPIFEYRLYKSTSGGAYVLIATTAAASPREYEDEDVIDDTGYTYYVVAVDDDGNVSANSNIVELENTAGLTIDIYTTADTWTKRPGLISVDVICIGAGGGGASGELDPGGTERKGGGGGGGGGRSEVIGIFAAALGATEAVIVGVGGPGGPASGLAGLRPGTDGGASSFGVHLTADGGLGGIGGDGSNPLSGTGGDGGAGNVASGGDGGRGAIQSADGQPGQSTALAPGGGGGGGGVTSGSVTRFPGAGGGGPTSDAVPLIGGAAATTTGGNGSPGQSSSINGGGAGGGGGYRAVISPTGIGGAGGAGGTYGAGGGGGGAATSSIGSTSVSGAGGNGGVGIVIVVNHL